MKTLTVSGYEALLEKVKELEGNGVQLNVYFTGNKDNSGQSWCPDCNQAEPHVMSVLKSKAVDNSIFLVVEVGEREYWKNMNNPFRKDTSMHLSVIPTLLRWKSPVRLEGDQLARPSLLEMFFEEVK